MICAYLVKKDLKKAVISSLVCSSTRLTAKLLRMLKLETLKFCNNKIHYPLLLRNQTVEGINSKFVLWELSAMWFKIFIDCHSRCFHWCRISDFFCLPPYSVF